MFNNAWLGFARAVKCRVDCFHHTMNIVGDLVVPKAKDTIALGLKPFFTQLIAPANFTSAMLRAVNLNNKMRRRAGKIDNEFADRHLPPKVSAARVETF